MTSLATGIVSVWWLGWLVRMVSSVVLVGALAGKGQARRCAEMPGLSGTLLPSTEHRGGQWEPGGFSRRDAKRP